jgi:hypothetical protein
MMLKVVFPHSFALGVPIARLADVHRGGIDSAWMQKRAAVLTKEIAEVRPEEDSSVIHLITMGSQEHYGHNRNGDGFNEKAAKYKHPEPEKGNPGYTLLDQGLGRYHQTFLKYAHVFKDHVNKDPKMSSGKVLAEAMNPEMHRGELLVRVNNDLWAPELEKLARGEDLAFSMSCKVPYDICTICGHKAANRKEYCGHLLDEMCHVKEGGWQVGAINDRPLFFDISGVFRPADRIAYGLQKVASTGEMPEEFIPSARIAELWGISAPASVLMDSSPRPVREKLAAMKRMAAMEKQIEAKGQLLGSGVDGGRPEGSMPAEGIEKMRGCDMNDLLGALSSAKICLPVGDFLRYVLGNKYDSVAGETDKVASLLPGIYSRMLESGDGVEDVTGMTTYDPGASLVSREVRDLIGLQKASMSMARGPVTHRLQKRVIRGESRNGPELRKVASDQTQGKTADWLAKQYAAYQLAFVRAAADAGGSLTEEMTVLRNYAA